jgi:hypothetical protein
MRSWNIGQKCWHYRLWLYSKDYKKNNADGYKCVNRNMPDYRCRLHKLGLKMNPTGNRKRKNKVVEAIELEDVPVPLPVPELTVDDNRTMVSPITEPDEMIIDSSS